ncbi:unnamed protein product [Lepeophtheirus salmonis]|uniref:(salmon louse) hypothetical protein n=1 Tax=Lepeophtheirus salmonis TaxID=72036 RepID=A0A7R8H1D8_LEPSM|nr:unnamed protein product [Lepeophtheirus salmonis]CAF2807527.1 unnamed protein product [Lepeophtheirus salmonis]
MVLCTSKIAQCAHSAVTMLCDELPASYNLDSCIAKQGKAFTDGEYINEAFLSRAYTLLDQLPNKDSITTQIKAGQGRLELFSDASMTWQVILALEESVDVNGISQLAVMARYSDSTTMREGLCCLQSMPDTTRGEDVATSITRNFEDRGVTMRKVFSVTTDGAPPMILGEIHSAHTDLPLQSAVRWLCCGIVFEHFVSCIGTIKVILAEKGQHYPRLEDKYWIMEVIFLADFTRHLNELNLRLEGAGKVVSGHIRKRGMLLSPSLQYFKETLPPPLSATSDTRIRPMCSFLIKPDRFDGQDLDTALIDALDVQDVEMQLIEMKSSSLCEVCRAPKTIGVYLCTTTRSLHPAMLVVSSS